MKHANLIAYLTGLLAVDQQKRGAAVGIADALAHEFWSATADDVAGSRPGGTIGILAHDRIQRLAECVATRISASLGELVAGYRDIDASVEAPQIAHTPLALLPRSHANLYEELLSSISANLQILEDKPEETPAATLRALWHMAAGMPLSAEQALEIRLPVLDGAAVSTLQELVVKRLSGAPLSHITGCQRFMAIEMHTSKSALIPRKETELLGYSALGILRRLAAEIDIPRVIDVCTGSGNLALSLASHESRARMFGSDLSLDAVILARQNCASLGLGDHVEFRNGDFLTPFADGAFENSIDLLVCNPPYISSAKVESMPNEIVGHEPTLAFDGGLFGIRILMRLISEAPRYLRRSGWLAFEVGLEQGPVIMERLRRNPSYVDLVAIRDTGGAVRAVVACV